MLIIYAIALLGIFRFRCRDYWKWLAILFVWMFSANLLFYAGGTLADPSGDGLITRQIRIATNDGPGMAIFAIAFLTVYWGSAIWIFRKMHLIGKQFEADIQQRAQETGTTVGIERKLAELFLATVVAAGYVYIAFFLPQHNNQPAPNPGLAPKVGTSDQIDSQLLQEANELNQSLPKQIDEVTKLVKVSAAGRVFTYHYEIRGQEITVSQLRQFVRVKVVQSACSNQMMRSAMKDHGVTYRYSYVLPGAPDPIDVDATYEVCAALG